MRIFSSPCVTFVFTIYIVRKMSSKDLLDIHRSSPLYKERRFTHLEDVALTGLLIISDTVQRCSVDLDLSSSSKQPRQIYSTNHPCSPSRSPFIPGIELISRVLAVTGRPWVYIDGSLGDSAIKQPCDATADSLKGGELVMCSR